MVNQTKIDCMRLAKQAAAPRSLRDKPAPIRCSDAPHCRSFYLLEFGRYRIN